MSDPPRVASPAPRLANANGPAQTGLRALHRDVVLPGTLASFQFADKVAHDTDGGAFTGGTQDCLLAGMRFGVRAPDAEIVAIFPSNGAAFAAMYINIKRATPRHKETLRAACIADAEKIDHRVGDFITRRRDKTMAGPIRSVRSPWIRVKWITRLNEPPSTKAALDRPTSCSPGPTCGGDV
ncbi:MAG: hypothetical protein U0350_42465 [Caldilineaceae bacterium]